MELKIKDRDYVADGMGGLVRVSGWVDFSSTKLTLTHIRHA